MKTQPLAVIGILVASLIMNAALWPTSAASGDAEQKPPAGESATVVLDVKEIFNKCEPFQEKLTALKTEVQRVQADLKARKEEVDALKAQAESVKEDPKRHEELNEQVRAKAFMFESDFAKQKQRFESRGAQLHVRLYAAIEEEVKRYAQENKVQLVLGHSPGPDLASTDRFFSRAVLYHQLPDVTATILARLNKSFDDANAAE